MLPCLVNQIDPPKKQSINIEPGPGIDADRPRENRGSSLLTD